MLLAVAVAVGVAAGYLLTDRGPDYQAQASIYVGSRQFAAVVDSPNAGAAMDRLTQTFAAMIKSDAVASAAIQAANAPRTPGQVVAATIAVVIPNTNYIALFVTDADPVVAQSLANGIAQSFVAEIQVLEPGAGAGVSAATLVFQRAARPSVPLPTSTRSNVLLGGMLGLAAGVAVVALLNYLDVSVKQPEEIERGTGLPVLAAIPVLPRSAARNHSAIAQPALAE